MSWARTGWIRREPPGSSSNLQGTEQGLRGLQAPPRIPAFPERRRVGETLLPKPPPARPLFAHPDPSNIIHRPHHRLSKCILLLKFAGFQVPLAMALAGPFQKSQTVLNSLRVRQSPPVACVRLRSRVTSHSTPKVSIRKKQRQSGWFPQAPCWPQPLPGVSRPQHLQRAPSPGGISPPATVQGCT